MLEKQRGNLDGASLTMLGISVIGEIPPFLVMFGYDKAITFCVVEVVRQSPRCGEWEKRILQKEAQLIHRLKSVDLLGFNERLNSRLFLVKNKND